MKRVLNKWQFIFNLHKDIQFIDGRYKLSVGVLKFKYFTEEGVMFRKDNYDGFFLQLWLRKPIMKVNR